MLTIAVADGAATDFPVRFGDATFTSGFRTEAAFSSSPVPWTSAPGFGGQIYLQPFPSGPPRRITTISSTTA